jgi:hypothetical protein
MSWVIVARGHPGITARHRTTFMVTKDREVGPMGDCIIAVGADKAGPDLSFELKQAMRAGQELVITLEVGGMTEKVHAFGHPSLTLNHPTDLVIRKSRFVCGRTLAIGADKAAADLQKKFVAAMRNPETKLELKIEVSAAHRAAY